MTGVILGKVLLSFLVDVTVVAVIETVVVDCVEIFCVLDMSRGEE